MSTGRRNSPALTALLTLAGIAILAWWIRGVHFAEIAGGLKSVGPAGFAAILALALLRFAVRSLVWTSLMRASGARVSFARVVAASIAGDAAGGIVAADRHAAVAIAARHELGDLADPADVFHAVLVGEP